jgi:small-conductance mechanosensitive channel
MTDTNAPNTNDLFQTGATLMERIYGEVTHHHSSTGVRILLIVALAFIAHLLVQLVGQISEWIATKGRAQESPLGLVTHQPKFNTLLSLCTNIVTSVVYFFAFGMILQECGVNLGAYLASATVVGLAISFGCQGLVQDFVIGLTLIFSDTMVVGDMVEIAGAVVVVGRVEEIGLRFTKLVNLYNQVVFIPNRTIANVSRFPDGGVFAYADIHLPQNVDHDKAVEAVKVVAQGVWRQFNAIILTEPVIARVQSATDSGWSFVRVQFKIWPGQGGLIENVFRQHMVNVMKAFDQNYTDWQVAVTYRTLTAG